MLLTSSIAFFLSPTFLFFHSFFFKIPMLLIFTPHPPSTIQVPFIRTPLIPPPHLFQHILFSLLQALVYLILHCLLHLSFCTSNTFPTFYQFFFVTNLLIMSRFTPLSILTTFCQDTKQKLFFTKNIFIKEKKLMVQDQIKKCHSITIHFV